jgi:hypothetical protein
MTLFVYDQDRIAFVESLRGALGQLCTSSFIRTFRTEQSSWQLAENLYQDLGILEFSQDDSCTVLDLALIAKEIGASLATANVIQSALLEGVAKRVVNLNLKDTPVCFGFETPSGQTLSFVPSNSCKSVIAIPNSGLLSSDNLSVYSCNLNNSSLHNCLDITELSFAAEKSSVSQSTLSSEQSRFIRNSLLIVLSAELCGIVEKIMAITTDYVKTRKQFGVPIGSFQAVSHQLSDCYLVSESCWSLVECAAVGMDDFTVKSAAMYCAENIPVALETTLQLHGGIGFTWEYDLHLYLRRARKIAALINPKASDYQQLLSLAV